MDQKSFKKLHRRRHHTWVMGDFEPAVCKRLAWRPSNVRTVNRVDFPIETRRSDQDDRHLKRCRNVRYFICNAKFNGGISVEKNGACCSFSRAGHHGDMPRLSGATVDGTPGTASHTTSGEMDVYPLLYSLYAFTRPICHATSKLLCTK